MISLSTYVQIGVVPFLTLLILFVNSGRNFARSINIRRFRVLACLIMTILVTDGVNWYLMQKGGTKYIPGLWLVNMMYFLLTELISWMWFLYVYHQLHGEGMTRKQKKRLRLAQLPLLISCAVILLSPWNRLIFYIAENGEYHRGAFHLIQTLTGFGYMGAASVLALLQRKKEELLERRNECMFLATVIALPLIGGSLQIYDFYLILLWPFATAAVFLLYTNFQHTKISMDNLTGLNNRGRLEQYLQQKCREGKRKWYLLFIDIDKFKEINDRFGHARGDCALQDVADVLRETFGGIGNTFLARYGGDEFAVIMEKDKDEEIEEAVEALEAAVSKKNRTGKRPYQLYLSIGYASWDAKSMSCLEDVANLADQRMYEQKQLHKGQAKKIS